MPSQILVLLFCSVATSSHSSLDVNAPAILGHRYQGTPACKSGLCAGLAHYPSLTNDYYAEFAVPGLPEVVAPSVTFYIYFNIFFAWPYPSMMNQFVPQLMLGNPLCNSSNYPYYIPKWETHKTWVFGSQYFFEIFNQTTNRTEGHAATGELFPAKEGEMLYTNFVYHRGSPNVESEGSYSASRGSSSWELIMGIKGDPSRVSTVKVNTPFMGLISETTTSWDEDQYNETWVNSCWELYNAEDRSHYPSTGHNIEMMIHRDQPQSTNQSQAFQWYTDWNTRGGATCPGSPNSTIHEEHNDQNQTVDWSIYWN